MLIVLKNILKMFNVIVQTPYCGFKSRPFSGITTIRFDTIKRTGVPQQVEVVEPLQKSDFGNLRADDFSIQTVKDAGLMATLKPCAHIKMSPLDAHECVIDAAQAMNDADFAEQLRVKQQTQPDEPKNNEPKE